MKAQRDLETIINHTAILGALWAQVPELRFGQFLVNIMKAYTATCNKDLFYAEDKEFTRFLKNYTTFAKLIKQ